MESINQHSPTYSGSPMVNFENSVESGTYGLSCPPPPPPPQGSNMRRRRPKTTVFDGPLTPNFILSSGSRMGFVTTTTTTSNDGKVVIPVDGKRPPTTPGGGSSTRTFIVDNRGMRTPGCLQNYCYD